VSLLPNIKCSTFSGNGGASSSTVIHQYYHTTDMRYNPSCVTCAGRGRHHVRDAGWQDIREGRREHLRCHGQPAAPGRPADEV